MPIYMNWGNSLPPKIKGDVTDSGHGGWIELSSVQVGAGRTVTASTGKSDRSTSKPTISEIVVTKYMDSSSNYLYRESMHGQATKVLLDLAKMDGGMPDIYLQLMLTNVLISSYSMSSGGDSRMESLTLNFTKLEWGSGQGLTPHVTMPPLQAHLSVGP